MVPGQPGGARPTLARSGAPTAFMNRWTRSLNICYTSRMPTALQTLLDLRDSQDRYGVPPAELRDRQLAAANERFAVQVEQIPLLRKRAESAGLSRIDRPADLVPLLFAHTTYKTYAEPWLMEGQWDRMAKWLATVSTYEPAAGFGDVEGLDDWISRLGLEGRYVASSSGTTGKPALMGATAADLEFSSKAGVSSFSWATGIEPARDRRFFGLGPRMNNARNEATRQAMVSAFATEAEEPYQLPLPPIEMGSVIQMILLRRRIAEGSAKPSEAAEFERLSRERQANMDEAQADAIDALVKAREHKLLLTGFFPSVYPLAMDVRERGYSGKDFHPDNAMLTGGGLKGTQLPPDYRETIFETFNLNDRRLYQLYSMQELNTPFPRCTSGRYHVAPWVIALPLDAPGEQLLDATQGEIEARAAFLDLSMDGRWGGIISGDRVNIDFGGCACGQQGPHIGAEITRYADLEGGDKISCAGTIDAYVRGES